MLINYQILGEGKPLYVIHGLFGTHTNLKAIATGLSDQYQTCLIDLPAHGESATVSPLTLQNMANSLVDLTNELGHDKISILGHSLGGKVAMEMAMIAPERIEQLIIADIAPVQYPRRHDVIINALQSVPLQQLTSRKQADEILAQAIDEIGVRAFLLKSLSKDQIGKWYWQFDLSEIANNYDNLVAANSQGCFDQQVLFIAGGNSNYISQEHQQDITSRFPKAKYKVIQNAGHWLHAEKPTAFLKICRDFLATNAENN